MRYNLYLQVYYIFCKCDLLETPRIAVFTTSKKETTKTSARRTKYFLEKYFMFCSVCLIRLQYIYSRLLDIIFIPMRSTKNSYTTRFSASKICELKTNTLSYYKGKESQFGDGRLKFHANKEDLALATFISRQMHYFVNFLLWLARRGWSSPLTDFSPEVSACL